MECIAKRHFFLMPIENRVQLPESQRGSRTRSIVRLESGCGDAPLRLTSCGDEFSAKATSPVKDLPVPRTINLSVFDHLTDRSAWSTPPHASVESDWRCLD